MSNLCFDLVIPYRSSFNGSVPSHADFRSLYAELSLQFVVVQLIPAYKQNVIVLLEPDQFHFFNLLLHLVFIVQFHTKVYIQICCPFCQLFQIPFTGVGIVLDVYRSQL